MRNNISKLMVIFPLASIMLAMLIAVVWLSTSVFAASIKTKIWTTPNLYIEGTVHGTRVFNRQPDGTLWFCGRQYDSVAGVYHKYCYISTDNGKTWTYDNSWENDITVSIKEWSFVFDSSGDGLAFYICETGAGASGYCSECGTSNNHTQNVVVKYWDNSTRTWSGRYCLTTEEGVIDMDYVKAGVGSDDTIYAVWFRTQSGVYFNYRPPGGAWQVASNTGVLGYPQDIFVDINDTVHLVSLSLSHIYYSQRVSGGTWIAAETVDSGNTISGVPWVGANSAGDPVVCWTGTGNGGNGNTVKNIQCKRRVSGVWEPDEAVTDYGSNQTLVGGYYDQEDNLVVFGIGDCDLDGISKNLYYRKKTSGSWGAIQCDFQGAPDNELTGPPSNYYPRYSYYPIANDGSPATIPYDQIVLSYVWNDTPNASDRYPWWYSGDENPFSPPPPPTPTPTPNPDTYAIFVSDISVDNTCGSAQTNVIAQIPLSSQGMIDGGYMETDGLNTTMIDFNGNPVRYMPGTANQDWEAVYQYDTTGATFTDYTVEANNATTGDVSLFDADPEVFDAVYFGDVIPFRSMRSNVGTAGVGTWEITWKYYNGATWAALPNVVDNSNGFTVGGNTSISWDLPDDWSVIDPGTGNAIYWVKAEITSYTSSTTSPLGTQFWWENAVWFCWIGDMSSGEEVGMDLYAGGTEDFRSYHQIFPGPNGISTVDDASLEPGNSFEIEFDGYIDTSQVGETIVNKDDTLKLYVSADGEITFEFYSRAESRFESSTSDGYYAKNDAVYGTAHDAATADSVDNTAVTMKIGQDNASNFDIWRSAVFFDTSILADDADIWDAELSLYGHTDASTDDFTIILQTGAPTYPSDPMVVGDYDYTHWSGNGGMLSSANFVTNGYNNILLTSTGIGWISKTGTTKFVMRSNNDINGTPQPDNSEYVLVYTSDDTDPGKRPMLTVGYEQVENSVVASGIASGEHNIKVTYDGSLLKLFVDGAMKDSVSETVSLLDKSTDWKWGDEDVTKYINWIKYKVSSSQVLWYQLNNLPDPDVNEVSDRSASGNDGMLSFPSLGDDCIIANVGPFVAIEDWVSMTPSSEAGPGSLFNLPPDYQFFQEGDGSGLPLYAIFSNTANEIGMDTSLLYAIAIISTAMGVGFLTLLMTGSTGLSLISIIALMSGGVAAGIISLWMVAVFALMSISLVYILNRG